MSERRTPYTTRGLPRASLPPIAELDAENEALLRQSLERAEETADLRQRLAALEAAAYEVCRGQDVHSTLGRDQAIRELGKLIAYPGWYQL